MLEWTLENKKNRSGPNLGHKTFLEVSALLVLRHCPKQQSCAINIKEN